MEFFLYTLAWVLSGAVLMYYGNMISDDPADSMSIHILCLLLGPFVLIAVIEQWSDNAWNTGVPWYRQGKQMKSLLMERKRLREEENKKLIKEHTLEQFYKVHLKNGTTISGAKAVEPRLYESRYPKCWHVDAMSRKQLQSTIVADFKEYGISVDGVVHPWHEVMSVQFKV